MKRIDIQEAVRKLYNFRPDESYTIDEVFAQCQQWHAEAFRCRRGEVCIHAGSPARQFLIVLSGALHLKQPSMLGEDILIRAVRPGEYAGLTLLYSNNKEYALDAIAAANTEIMFFSVNEVRKWRTDPKAQPLFDYIGGLMSDIIRESEVRTMIMSARDIAERLRRYLSVRMQKDKSKTITLPGNLEDFAHYLGVNRSALSRILGKLKEEGKIEYCRSVIKILDHYHPIADIVG